jgi:hypothetical protein
MSWEDDIIWRAHLDLYDCPAEPLPIIDITQKKVWTEEWSGKMIFPDGSHENIGKRKRLAFDREELKRNGSVYRGRVLYSLDNPDERLRYEPGTEPDHNNN